VPMIEAVRLICWECKKLLSSWKTLRRHYLTHHKGKIIDKQKVVNNSTNNSIFRNNFIFLTYSRFRKYHWQLLLMRSVHTFRGTTRKLRKQNVKRQIALLTRIRIDKLSYPFKIRTLELKNTATNLHINFLTLLITITYIHFICFDLYPTRCKPFKIPHLFKGFIDTLLKWIYKSQ